MNRRGKTTRHVRILLATALLTMVLTIALGAYWAKQILEETGSHDRRKITHLLKVEEVMNQATIAMSAQTQEWKDVLIRSHDAELLAKHKQAFEQQHRLLKNALEETEALMVSAEMDIAALHALRSRLDNLHQKYEAAYALLNPKSPFSFRAADESVRGADRQLRTDLLYLQDRIELEVQAQLSHLGMVPEHQQQTFYLLGALGIFLPLISGVLFYLAYRSIRLVGRSDAHVRTVFEAITDAVIVTDMDGKIISLNHSAQQMLGWQQTEAQGQFADDVLALYTSDGHTRVDSPVERVRQEGIAQPPAKTRLLKARGGSEYFVEDSASPVLNEHNEVIGVVVVFRNVSARYELSHSLDKERAVFRQTVDNAAVGIANVGLNGVFIRTNPALCEMLGYSADELSRMTFHQVNYPDDLQQDLPKMKALLEGKITHFASEKRYVRKDKSQLWVSLSASLIRKTDLSPDYFVAVLTDIQARKDAELSASIAEQQFQSLFEQMPEGVLVIDQEMAVVSFNQEALRQLDYTAEELLKLHVWEIDANDNEILVRQRAQKLRTTGSDEFESRYRTRNGHLLDVQVSVRRAKLPSGEEIFQCLFRDISEQIATSRQIEYLAYHDQLTGLANRRLLNDRLGQAISGSLRHDAQLAVLYLDLDHFKDVNDSFGHLLGDSLLKMVATRLQQCVRTEDTLARVGGDEFVIMLKNVSNLEDITAIAQKIIRHISQPMVLNKEELRVSPSIGISIFPGDGKDADTLLKNADAALYQAKQQGRATHRFYTEALHAKSVERLQIERLLHQALEYDEFELYYQAKVNLPDQKVIGCEALLRWNHVGVGTVSPAQFIPAAEKSRLIIEIGNWVIRAACRQAAEWQRQGINIKVAFNISARQFMQPDELLQSLRNALDESGVNPHLLEIEITESLLLDPQSMGSVLEQICSWGLAIALDDFGTGYSSLSYLRRFPISTLKIDRSFVSNADQNSDDAEMVKTIIDMAHNLRMTLVAEGIETVSQLDLLQRYSCETGQGYLFSRPLPRAEFEALLKERD